MPFNDTVRIVDGGFGEWARPLLEGAGYTVSDDDLALIELIHTAGEPGLAALAAADIERYPHEPVDPSRAP
jgi:hypothetical protein